MLGETKKAANYLSVLHTRLSEANDSEVSSYTATNLGTGAFQIGKLIELNSLLCFHNSVMVNCVEKLLAQISRHIE